MPKAGSGFPGFPAETFRFLKALARNNRREWFLERKDLYQRYLRTPMESFVLSVAGPLARMAPELIANPKSSPYRIYRDTRFSPDKSPYKTHLAAVFPPRGLAKHTGAGLYVHVSPKEVFAGGGLYRPESRDLAAVRHRLAVRHEEFRRVLGRSRFRRVFGSLGGERLQRIPRGFASDHPAQDLLRHKQFLASRRFDPEIALTERFLPLVLETFEALLPMLRFLNVPILERHAREVADDPLLDDNFLV